jgi:phospholipase D1/2
VKVLKVTNPKSFFVEGRNCWNRTQANRLAFLIDGEAYFKAFKEAALKARRSIFIISWDIDSHVLLTRDGDRSGFPNQLGDFLGALLERRRDLHIHVLNWDFSLIYIFERMTQPFFRVDFKKQRRFHFRLDGTHPIGASHHQKIVVIDDSVGFTGGFDLTHARWDTPAHHAHDPKRIDPNGMTYGPFHDIQVIVDGNAAMRLGDIARERWAIATGQDTQPVSLQEDPWPPYLRPDMKDVSIAISRTLPAFMGRPEVREVETLYLDMVASAQRFIYIEQQYFTSARTGEALAARLKEENGPEILLILPKVNSGWLEENSMGLLRTGLLKRLRQADVHGHLGVYYPVVPDDEEVSVNVHSKIMVIDDRMARVGSSNLSNRSMGLDTECDLTVESEGDPQKEGRIAEFRNLLLAEHLGVSPEKIAEVIASKNSLLGAVEALRGSKRTLRPLVADVPEWMNNLLPETPIFDLERPLDEVRLIEEFVPTDMNESAGRPFVRGALLLVLLVILAGLWKWSPLKEWIDLQPLMNWADSFRGNPMTSLIVIAFYVIGGLVMFPVLLLIFATTFTFDPLAGILYSFAGCFSSAIAGYGIGKMIGRDVVRRLAGVRLNQMSRRLARRGLDAIIFLRIVPLLPFTLVNLVAGASHLRFRDYVLGTMIGMTPGIFFITLFQASLSRAISSAESHHFPILIAIAAAILGVTWFLTRWIDKAGQIKFSFAKLREGSKRRRWFRRKSRQGPSP